MQPNNESMASNTVSMIYDSLQKTYFLSSFNFVFFCFFFVFLFWGLADFFLIICCQAVSAVLPSFWPGLDWEFCLSIHILVVSLHNNEQHRATTSMTAASRLLRRVAYYNALHFCQKSCFQLRITTWHLLTNTKDFYQITSVHRLARPLTSESH